jgi:hypothetical protein
MQINPDTKTNTQLILHHDEDVDESFFNLMRRLILRDAKRDMFKTIVTEIYESDLPEDAVRHSIRMLPVKGAGPYELDVEAKDADRRVTSNDIEGEGQVEADVPIMTLAKGTKIRLRLHAESVAGAQHPETAPFLLTREGEPPKHVLEPLSSIHDKKDCADAIRDCLNTIRGYADAIENALADV